MTTPLTYVIDGDAPPFVPRGWKVKEHKKNGKVVLDFSKITLHLSPNQQEGRSIEGNELSKELVSYLVHNANVLDYLLAHPELIPEDWKRDSEGNLRYIFFWGTKYHDSGGYPVVRCLYWFGGVWCWGDFWLDFRWRGYAPAAALAQ